ncbi:MAG: arsenic efflux protein [Candidatus Moranbacteria bacterium]|nr:arsenic efflux protein [Candidatus Moranbacteria bacterium]
MYMYDLFIDALIDSAKTIPFLLAVYIGIEFIESSYTRKILEKIERAGSAGPIAGALAGILPQCGFSVFATALYTQRLLTIGTLMAVYLATSDEALPVMLSHPGGASLILPLIIAKLAIAVVFGYLLDLAYRKDRKRILGHIAAYNRGKDDPKHVHCDVLSENACCGHHVEEAEKNFDAKISLLHPLKHALKIFLFIFIATLAINIAFSSLGDAVSSDAFLGGGFFQPFLAALFGLIPNCAVSVGITELYLKGSLTFGSAIAGLSANGGLGILILFKEEKDKREALKIVAILFAASVLAGVFLQYAPQLLF